MNEDQLPDSNSSVSDVIISLKAQPAKSEIPDQSGKNACNDDPPFEWTSLFCLNLAIQQSGISLVPEVIVRNQTKDILENLVCTVSVSPAAFVPEKSFPIETIKPGKQSILRNLRLDPDFGRLLELPEPVRGAISIAIRRGEEQLFAEERPLEIYAPDQSAGNAVLPELQCAFVMPNLPCVRSLVRAVSEELRESTGDSAVEGYQSGRDRAYAILQACYRALHSVGIRYAMPPASLDMPGQRVRLPDTVVNERLGTCLETTFLMASLVEACGLHPVLMKIVGHAFLGCHLDETHFPDPATDDLATVRKRMADDEFTVVETTCLTKEGCTFSQAESIAREQTNGLPDSEFVFAIDVRRARYSGIRPLPLRSVEGGSFALEEPPPEGEALRAEGTRELREAIDLAHLAPAERKPKDRATRWQQKLLDLSSRNRLLNVREGRFSIPIMCPEIGIMEDQLAAGTPLTVGSLFNLLGEKDYHDLVGKTVSDLDTPRQALLKAELKHHRLWTTISEKVLPRLLTNLYRESRTDLEETGVNTLFLALGLLAWTPSVRSNVRYHAPILLVPVRGWTGARSRTA